MSEERRDGGEEVKPSNKSDSNVPIKGLGSGRDVIAPAGSNSDANSDANSYTNSDANSDANSYTNSDEKVTIKCEDVSPGPVFATVERECSEIESKSAESREVSPILAGRNGSNNYSVFSRTGRMAESDEEFDRHQRHDKFTRERREYQGSSRGRREDWMEEERGSGWSSNRGHGGRDNYGRDYNRDGYGRRDRHSPGRGDPSPPTKRMRGREWDGDRGFGDRGFGDRGFGDRGFGDNYGGNWSQGDHRQQPGGSDNCPTQPPMMTFKQFLQRLDDEVAETDAVKKYNDYKMDFKKKQLKDFFDKHKDEEWFRVKYHPDECDRWKEEHLAAIRKRLDVFKELLDLKWIEDVSVDVEHADKIIRLLDAAVIKLEGGTELDLQSLDEKPEEQVKPKEPELSLFAEEPKKDVEEPKKDVEEPKKDVEEEEKDVGVKNEEKLVGQDEGVKNEDTEMKSEEAESEVKEEPKEVKEEPKEVKAETEEVKTESEATVKPEARNGESKEGVNGDVETAESAPTEPRPRSLHRTASIFLRNLPPNVVKSEVEAVCKRYNGFMRLAIADPQAERRFYRRGWITFEKNVNIRDICWQLSGIKFNNTETGAIINRDLSRRIRSVNGIASHKNVVRADIRHAAKIIVNLDKEKKLWIDAEKGDEEESTSSGFILDSKNPLLRNITDYMIEEASAEEEELLGADAGEIEDGEGGESGPSLERDEAVTKVLDRLLLYLRLVHSVDYYNHTDYPQEDEMPNRIGIMHARGSPPSSKVTMKEVNEYIKSFETKIQPYLEPFLPLSDEEVSKLGRLDPEKEIDKFVEENTKRLGPEKYQCQLSNKKFKAPEFVKKHIFNRYPTEVENVRKMANYFNNYIRDGKRPQLPEHPSNRPPAPLQQSHLSSSSNQRGNDLTPSMAPRGPWPPYAGIPHPPYTFTPGIPPRPPYPPPAPGMTPGWNPIQPFPMVAPGFGLGPSGTYSNRGRPARNYRDLDAPED